jgi:hypothetical protein
MIAFLREIVLTWLFARFGLRGCISCGCLLVLTSGLMIYIVINAVVTRF